MTYHASSSQATTSIPTTTETVVGVLTPGFNINNPSAGQGLHIAVNANVLAGTNATALQLRVYRGAGTVGSAPTGLTQVGASGNGTCNYMFIGVEDATSFE